MTGGSFGLLAVDGATKIDSYVEAMKKKKSLAANTQEAADSTSEQLHASPRERESENSPYRARMERMLTDKQKQEILDEAFEQVKAGVVENAIEHVDWNIKHELSTRTNNVVQEWVLNELKPELVASLNENKSFLIDAALVSAESMAKELAKVMSAKMAENLASPYDRRKIIEALFG